MGTGETGVPVVEERESGSKRLRGGEAVSPLREAEVCKFRERRRELKRYRELEEEERNADVDTKHKQKKALVSRYDNRFRVYGLYEHHYEVGRGKWQQEATAEQKKELENAEWKEQEVCMSSTFSIQTFRVKSATLPNGAFFIRPIRPYHVWEFEFVFRFGGHCKGFTTDRIIEIGLHLNNDARVV